MITCLVIMSTSHFIILVLMLFGGVRPEGLCQCKIAITQSEIEPATFGLVSQCLNQLSYRVHSFAVLTLRSSCSTKENYSLSTAFGVSFSVLWCVLNSLCSHSVARFVLLPSEISRRSPCFISKVLFMYSRAMYLHWGSGNLSYCVVSLQIDNPSWIELRTAQRETRHFSIFLVGGCPIGNRSRGNHFFFFCC